jgi:hypothetical protein
MLAQHTAYNYGLADVGRDFLYRQFKHISQRIQDTGGNDPTALHAAVGAARLAPRVHGADGVKTAIRHYQQSIRLAADPVLQADLIYAIANLCAHQRQSAFLALARQWYRRGYRLLPRITEAEDGAYVEIRLANGLALVAYHQGCDDEALALEQRAQAVVQRVKAKFPHLEKWASPILNANGARLLERRFGDIPAAMRLLEANIEATEPIHRENARFDLARLSFDYRDHHRVIDLLAPIYDEGHPVNLDEQQELFGRLMFGISLSIAGDVSRSRRQLARLTYLLHVTETEGAQRLLLAIRHVAAEHVE